MNPGLGGGGFAGSAGGDGGGGLDLAGAEKPGAVLGEGGSKVANNNNYDIAQ